jgi:NADH:ubiquinone oxidoreductase subunit B-like Fe-S oxidoreductase
MGGYFSADCSWSPKTDVRSVGLGLPLDLYVLAGPPRLHALLHVFLGLLHGS